MNDVKRREFFRTILMVASILIVVSWLSVAYTALTGLTVATRSRLGRVATEADRERVRHVAVMATVIAAPVAFWAWMNRRG